MILRNLPGLLYKLQLVWEEGKEMNEKNNFIRHFFVLEF